MPAGDMLLQRHNRGSTPQPQSSPTKAGEVRSIQHKDACAGGMSHNIAVHCLSSPSAQNGECCIHWRCCCVACCWVIVANGAFKSMRQQPMLQSGQLIKFFVVCMYWWYYYKSARSTRQPHLMELACAQQHKQQLMRMPLNRQTVKFMKCRHCGRLKCSAVSLQP